MKFTNYAVAIALCATSSVFAATTPTAPEAVVKAIHDCATEHKDVVGFKNCCSDAKIEPSLLETLTKHLKNMGVMNEDHIKTKISENEMILKINGLAKTHATDNKFHEELKNLEKEIGTLFGKDVYDHMMKMKPHELDEQAEVDDILEEERHILQIMNCKETDKANQEACLKAINLGMLSKAHRNSIINLSASDIKTREQLGSIFHKDHEEKVQAVHTALIAGIGKCNNMTGLAERTQCLKELGKHQELSQAKIDELVKKEAKDLATADQITKHAHSIVRSKTNVYASHPWYTQPMVWIGTVLLVAVIAIFLYYYNSKKQSAEESTDL